VDVLVRRNDEIDVAAVEEMHPERLVISPGPCTPAEAGISVEVIRQLGPRIPTLGVCLGHQAIGAAFGGRIIRARRTMHGKLSPVAHAGRDLFEGIPSPFQVTRYHSLVIDPGTVPEALEVTARTAEPGWEDEIQGIRHREHPIWGVQFHPESIASQYGRELVANFLSST
jgi:anthranilate synthase component 2